MVFQNINSFFGTVFSMKEKNFKIKNKILKKREKRKSFPKITSDFSDIFRNTFQHKNFVKTKKQSS